MRQAELLIYGDPKQFPEYGRKALEHGPPDRWPNSGKIQFKGTFPNGQLGGVLQNLDVLVVPSRWYENTPLVMWKQSALATKNRRLSSRIWAAWRSWFSMGKTDYAVQI